MSDISLTTSETARIRQSYRMPVATGDASLHRDGQLALDKILEVGLEFELECARINADRRLSEEGRADARMAAGRTALAELDRLERVSYVAKVRTAAEQARAELEAELPPADSAAVSWRETEVRHYFGQLEPLNRRIALIDAARAGDRLSVAAAVRAPSVLGLFDATDIAEALGILAEAGDPEAAHKLQVLEEILETVLRALEDLRQGIRDAAGLDAAEPVFAD